MRRREAPWQGVSRLASPCSISPRHPQTFQPAVGTQAHPGRSLIPPGTTLESRCLPPTPRVLCYGRGDAAISANTRFGASLNCHIHHRCCAIDEVFEPAEDTIGVTEPLRFRPAAGLTPEAVAAIVEQVRSPPT